MEYAQRGVIDEWIQLFLRNEGQNIALADGLLLKKRYYIGQVLTDISKFGIEEIRNWNDQDTVIEKGILHLFRFKHPRHAMHTEDLKGIP